MRIALFGLGRIGQIHAANLSQLDDVDLVVFDPLEGAVAAIGGHIEHASSVDAALDGAAGVVVATPTALHTDHVVAAATAGCAVFSEKPISLDLATSRSVIDLLADQGLPLQVGFQRRFDPGCLAIRQLIADGDLGELYLVRTACHDREPPHEEYLATSGSIFKDMHTHDFDAIAWLTGRRIESVYAQGSVLIDDMFARQGDVDTCALTLTLEGGALAVVTGARNNGVGYDHRIEVFGSADSVSAGFTSRTPLRSTDPGGHQTDTPYAGFADRFAAAYQAEMAAFVDLVAGRGPNRCPGEHAVEALRVAVAADRSLASGAAVAVADVADDAR